MPRYHHRKVNAKPFGPLPVLTLANTDEHSAWHEYYQRVYHHPVTEPVDLNEFSWFYWHAPITDEQRENIVQLRSVTHGVEQGVAFVYTVPSLVMEGRTHVPSETQVASAGFFVRRHLSASKLCGPNIEVMRTTDSIIQEHGVAWFYVTIGSGFWVTCGRTVYYKTLFTIPGTIWDERDPYPTMASQNVQSVIRHAGSAYAMVGLPELVFRLDSRDTLANEANIPMLHDSPEGKCAYSAIYHPDHRCLTQPPDLS